MLVMQRRLKGTEAALHTGMTCNSSALSTPILGVKKPLILMTERNAFIGDNCGLKFCETFPAVFDCVFFLKATAKRYF